MTTASLLQLLMTMLTLVSFLATRGVSQAQAQIPSVDQKPTFEGCLPCELFFRKLERSEEGGKLSRVVNVQLRGEPKSGTGIMFDWATAALVRTCDYLQLLFGEESCVLESGSGERVHITPHLPVIVKIVFEPALGASDARCPCDTIESVSILLSQVNKHMLPVDSASCAFSHKQGMDVGAETGKGYREKSACKFPDGATAKNNEDLWRCMHEANCDITDDSLQMVIFRDPRPAVVSSYYHLRTYTTRKIGDLAGFVARELPILCEWLALRHILFSGVLRHQSTEFWYDEAMDDPLEWYYHWFDFVGLQLPHSVVYDAAKAAGADDLGFRHKSFERHPGEKKRTGVRKFEDEVSPEVLETADAVLREWLPPVLLEKLGIEPTQVGR